MSASRGEVAVELTVSAAKERAAKHGRLRAWVLLAVHLVIAVHIAHWMLAGRTVAPMELNESMYTLEQGAITVGGILMALILLSVLVFGRFFCAWGCHILALQDGAAWILARMHIRPRPIRSRFAGLIGITVALSMFAWPQVQRWMDQTQWPGLRVTTDADGFGSLMTADFLRNLPGPWVTAVTFLVCGGVMVWLLGSRSFCRVACPYGAVFSIADRMSIGGIRLVGDCDKCGLCTAHCTSHIRVHEELLRHGRVVSPNCLKDLDCVKVCPTNAIAWRLGKPSLLRSLNDSRTMPGAWEMKEDLLLLVIAAICTVIFRSLYGEVPFFLAVALGVIVGWMGVMSLRMRTKSDLRLFKVQLRRSSRDTEAGTLWWITAAAMLALVVHSGWIRLHESLGRSAWERCMATPQSAEASGDALVGSANLEIVLAYGLWRPPYAHRMLTDLYIWSNRPDLALPHATRMTEIWPEAQPRWEQLATVLRLTGQSERADEVGRLHPPLALNER